MARPAPPFKTNRSSDRARTLTAITDLQAVSGCPDFGPQRCLVIGTGASGAGSVTFATEDGASLVVPASAEGTPVPVPVTDISAITTATVLALWWIIPAKDDQQLGPFPLNP